GGQRSARERKRHHQREEGGPQPRLRAWTQEGGGIGGGGHARGGSDARRTWSQRVGLHASDLLWHRPTGRRPSCLRRPGSTCTAARSAVGVGNRGLQMAI